MRFKIASFLSFCLLPFLCSASQTISDPSMASTSPSLDVNTTNQALASWVAYDGANNRTQVATYDGTNWSTQTTLSDPNVDAETPAISYNDNGQGAAIWQSTDPTQGTVTILSTLYNSSWGSIATLSDPSNAAITPQIVVNSNGDALATWIEGFTFFPLYFQLFSSQYSGGSWSTPTSIATNYGGVANAQVGFNSSGNGISVWASNNGSNFEILASFYSSGSWSTPQLISSSGIQSFTPVLRWNDNNQALVAWQAYLSSNVQVQAITFDGSSWGSVQTLSNQSYDALAPYCALDSSGDGLVTWGGYAGSSYGVFVATLPNGGSWSSPTIFSTTGADYNGPVAGLNDNSQAIVAWVMNPWNTSVQVIQSVSFSGGSWASPVSLSDPTGTAQTPCVSFNNAGSAIVGWDLQNGGTDLIQVSLETVP